MKRSYKLQVLFTSIGLIAICLIIMILVVNFSGSKKEDTNGIIKNSLTDENDTLKLTGKLPISDFVVKTKDVLTFDEGVVDYVGFNVTSQGYNGDFTIFVDDCNEEGAENIIDSTYIKVMVTDSENNLLSSTLNGPVTSYDDLKVYKDKSDKKIAFIDSINSGTQKEYIVKTWVSNSMLADPNKSYCLKVSVE